MSDAWDLIFARTNGVEGRYSNNPLDAGGATMFGITERIARKYGYTGHMEQMPLSEAKRIGKLAFWDQLNLDTVIPHSFAIAQEMYDTYFNTGQCWLQRALNRFNRQQKLYPDVREDNQIGPATIAALTQYLDKRGKDSEMVMLRALNSLQCAYYFTISDEQHRESNEEFVYGWVLNRVEIK